MKIFRILEKELTGDTYEWHMMPDSTVVRTDNPFFIPEFDTEFKAYPVVAIKIGRLGKSIAPKFAHRYYNEATLAATVRAENLLAFLRRGGMPWERAVSFDRSCFMGEFVPADELLNCRNASISCGEEKLELNISEIRSTINETIACISRDNTLKTGDLLLIPATGKGLRLSIGDNLTEECDSGALLEIRIK